MSMNLGDLLQMVRQDYLDTLQEAWDEARKTDAAATLEPPMPDGAWADMHAQNTLKTVPSEGVFQFEESITFGWGDALPGQPEPLQVQVLPFAWDAMPFTLVAPKGKALNTAPLTQWFEQWAAEPEEAEPEDAPFRAVAHSLKAGPNGTWVADMGSAPLEAWQDLLDAALATGAQQIIFGGTQKG